MYKLRDFLTSVLGISPDEVTSEELYCSESNTRLTFVTNQMQETLAGYSYTLVHDGWLKVLLGGRLLTQPSFAIFNCKGTARQSQPGCKVTAIPRTVQYRKVGHFRISSL